MASTISNTAPTVSGVALNNLSPYTNDVLTVSGTTYDFNGDSVTLNYEWHVMDASNGGQDTIIQLGAGTAFSSLDGSQMMGFDRDDEVYVLVTPNDGTDNGTTVESDHAVVLNTAPSAPSVAVTSTANPPIEGVDDLTCTIVGSSTDDDGDSVTYTYTWYDPNGIDVQILANTSTTTDTFLGGNTTSGLWECVVEASDGTDATPTTADIEVDADWDGLRTFTNCAQTGRTGPAQSDCNAEYSGTTLDGFVSVNSGYQTWTVPSNGTYFIEAYGASGGDSVTEGYDSGGSGALVSGEFTLLAGDQLEMLVGQQGLGTTCGGGGGGGTFVVQNGSPLLVAGGGGGAMSMLLSSECWGTGFDAPADDTCGTNGGFNDCYNGNSAVKLAGVMEMAAPAIRMEVVAEASSP